MEKGGEKMKIDVNDLMIEFDDRQEFFDLLNFMRIAKNEITDNERYASRFTDNEKQSCNEIHASLKSAFDEYVMEQKARENDMML